MNSFNSSYIINDVTSDGCLGSMNTQWNAMKSY
jgi:hypothetical protein